MRFQGHRRRRQEDDCYSNNKTSNGSNIHQLKSAILISRASLSEVRGVGDMPRAMPWAMPRVMPWDMPLALPLAFPVFISSPQSPFMQSADARTSSPLCKRQRHNIRDASGKLVSKHIMSLEFMCRYIDWRKSRLAMLPSTRKRDRG